MLHWFKPSKAKEAAAREHCAAPLAVLVPAPSIDWRAAMHEAVVEIDAEGRQRSFTPGAQATLAPLTHDDALYLVDRLRASDRVVFLHAHARVRGGEARVEVSLALRLDAAGREWAELSAVLVPGTDGATLVLLREATEAAAEPDVETIEPDAPVEAVPDAIAELAHELRTPLNAVAGYAGAMRAELFGPLNPRQREAMDAIETASTHVVEVSNAVLDAARFGNCAAVAPEQASPVDAVERACVLVASLAKRGRITLANRVTAHAGEVPHDAAALRQVLVNLLTNAIKASPVGATVSIEARRLNGSLAIAVCDGGCGMTEAELARLGTRFARGTGFARGSASAGEATGGLGLVLVRRLVEGHGGTLDHSSAQGRGTVATVTLPLEGKPVPAPALRPTVVPIGARIVPCNDDTSAADSGDATPRTAPLSERKAV